MIKKFAPAFVAVILAALAHHAQAQANLTFVGNGYVILDVNGAGDTYYDVNNQSNDNVTPSFDTDDSSNSAFTLTINILQGQSILFGGQLQTFPQANGTSAFFGYRITNLSETTGSFSELNLPFQQQTGQNDQWQQLASTSGVDLGSSLAPGSYLLEVYEHATNTNSIFNQEGAVNDNWEARIVVSAVPEPSSLALLGGASLLGTSFFLRRRRKS